MFIVIGFMFTGMLVGYLLRKRKVKFINNAITILIWALLLLLGIEVGGNKEIIKALPVIGMEAIAITIAGLLGSLIAARLLWKHFSKREKKRA
ncbi:LysO family transporter [Phocaeicola paurosaccharolyticus]|jgi:uncharacterized membrane protein YbjE (DUF340 family)|uniref:LysO family transporter n=1 Tax=Phocaeicola paurosaccharolyticus TaxID=732242 RepID=UPI000469EED4|nr:LysO family transporter [Phocaeicola paurosaccharolyticus]